MLDIPSELKELYKIVWEIQQKSVIIQAAGRGPFIDQTQSMNIFMEADYQRITSCHFASWKLGLKTGMYYLRSRSAVDAVKVTVSTEKFAKERFMNSNEDEECITCSA